ncbi:transcriptional regulator [Actinomadura harenae]|nr:transcriptional regulator [Actinomadura harenae]
MARRIRRAASPGDREQLAHVQALTHMIKEWERGLHRPSPRYRSLYALATGRTEDELFGPERSAQRAEPLGSLPGLPLPSGELSARLAEITGRRVGAGIVTDLAARVHGLRLADDLLAGGDLFVPAVRELENAIRVHRESSHSEQTSRELLALIGEFAQIAGWVASDAGEHDRAAEIYRLGIDAAREAGDRTLESNLLGSLAYQVANVGEPAEGVELARASLDVAGPDAPPRARALAWDRFAWANARAQDRAATVEALGQASAALDQNEHQDADPGYLYWVSEGELQVMEARAYTELRRPLRAVPLLADVLSRYDATHTRELALYLSWLAVALVDANEPEEAAAVTSRMLDLSAEVASDRTAKRAHLVLERLRPFESSPPVAQVLREAPEPRGASLG